MTEKSEHELDTRENMGILLCGKLVLNVNLLIFETRSCFSHGLETETNSRYPLRQSSSTGLVKLFLIFSTMSQRRLVGGFFFISGQSRLFANRLIKQFANFLHLANFQPACTFHLTFQANCITTKASERIQGALKRNAPPHQMLMLAELYTLSGYVYRKLV